MSNILLIKDSEGASSDEFFQIMQRYAVRNVSECCLLHTRKVTLKHLAVADVIICIRGATPYMHFILKLARVLNKKIVYFLDDALKDIPNDSFMYPNRKQWHIKCVEKSDVLLTTNIFIAEDYKKVVPNIRTAIIHTAVNEIKPYMQHDDGIKIVYAASEWHINNYNDMIAPIIGKLLELDNIEIYLVGFKPIGIHNNRIHVVPKMCFKDYQNFMNDHNFDIGLAPLEKSYFSERKYFNKFIEYTRYGICGIYSDTYPYRFVVKNEENGILVSNEPNEWLYAIQKLIDDKQLRSTCVKKAQEYLLTEHSDEVIFTNLEKDIPEICTVCSDKNEVSVSNMQLMIRKLLLYYPFFVLEKLYMLRYSIRKEGPKKAIIRILKKFKGGFEK